MVLEEYTIERIGNYGKITPLPDNKLTNALYNHLSYEKKGIEFMPNRLWGIVHFYNKKKGLFPWGLYSRVFNIFNQYSLKVKSISIKTLDKPLNSPLMLDNPLFRPYQLETVNALQINNGGVVSVPTGGGKTFIAMEYLKHTGLESLIIVTTLDIKRLWEAEIGDCPHIRVINYQNKNALKMALNAQIVVFDESHHLSCKSIYKIAMSVKTGTQLIGLSATPFREDGEDMRLEAALGEIVYTITRKELIEQGYLSDAIIKYKKIDYSVETHITYDDEYKKYIVNNLERNNSIVKLALEESSNNKKVLILVNQISHGVELMKLINHERSIFLHGSVKDRSVDLDRFDIIVASTIFNEGVNLPALDVLILASAGKSEIMLTQRVGRVLRLSKFKGKAVVYDFIDNGKYLHQHYKKRRALLEKDFEVVDI